MTTITATAKTLARNLSNAKANGVDNMATITRILTAVRADKSHTELLETLGEDGIKVNAAMAEQCRKWLLSLHYTPKGKEKEGSPFGYREVSAVENFGSVVWADTYSLGSYGHLTPIFNVCEKDGSFGFQYYVGPKGISIIG